MSTRQPVLESVHLWYLQPPEESDQAQPEIMLKPKDIL